ncbi:hypothetical protein ABT187_14390 [Streptomyces sp. NPDC001817]|uniref:hypothetical protein n=1 Tax=Streptomyces sp. NPDC001817 TaxID=3154398 RepID=UPI003329B963
MNAPPASDLLPADEAQDDRRCMAVRLLGRVEKHLDETLQRRHGLPLSEYRALCTPAGPTAGRRCAWVNWRTGSV